jgi:protein disulfide-isomerase
MDRKKTYWRPTGSLICLLATTIFAASGCNKSSLKDFAPLRPTPPGEDSRIAESSGDAAPDSVTLTVWQDSMDAAMEASAQSGKPILANFTGSDWCGWCVKLKKDVFETNEFKQWARENVILLELDYPKRRNQPVEIKRQNAELKSRYGINGYPTILLLSADGEPIGSRLGYRNNPDDWIETAETQLRPFRTAARTAQK